MILGKITHVGTLDFKGACQVGFGCVTYRDNMPYQHAKVQNQIDRVNRCRERFGLAVDSLYAFSFSAVVSPEH